MLLRCFYIIDEIRNKNGRIQEILNELKVQEEYFTPTWNDSEFPQRVVEVKDDEIPGKNFFFYLFSILST